jgi:hypothetical protein
MTDKGSKGRARRNRASAETRDEESFLQWAEEHPERADVSARYQRDYGANRRRPRGKTPPDKSSGKLAPALTARPQAPKLPRSDAPDSAALGPLGIARIICAQPDPPEWLVAGLETIWLRLQVGSHELKKRSSEDIRAEMGRILKATKTLQDALKDEEVLPLLDPDSVWDKNSVLADLNWIAERAVTAAVKKKQGRPKKVSDLLSMQYCCAVVASAAWLEVRREFLSGSNIEGQEACEMFWRMIPKREKLRLKHKNSVNVDSRSKQHGVTSVRSYGVWKEWLEKALIIVEASNEDRIFPSKRKWEASRRNPATGKVVEIEQDGAQLQISGLNEEDRLHLKFVRDVRKIFQLARASDEKEKS